MNDKKQTTGNKIKTILKQLIILGFNFGIAFQLHAQGYIVPNGVTYAGNDPNFGSIIHVLQNPTNSDHTGFLLRPEGANTFLFGSFLDEGVRVFLVSFNQPISLSAISSQSYTELLYPNRYVFTPGFPIYVGLYTGYDPFSKGMYTGIYRDPLFGWARLVNNQGVIQLTRSALVYGAEGIYAGTETIIPEPGIYSLLGWGVFLLAAARATLKRKQ